MHGEGTDKQTHGHRDSMTESAQWADSVKIAIPPQNQLKYAGSDGPCEASLAVGYPLRLLLAYHQARAVIRWVPAGNR